MDHCAYCGYGRTQMIYCVECGKSFDTRACHMSYGMLREAESARIITDAIRDAVGSWRGPKVAR